MTHEWNSARIARLRELWPLRTAKQIAQDLGVTRNAVLSKARGLNLEAKRVKGQDEDAMFERVIDIVTAAEHGHPISVASAARRIGMRTAIAEQRWADLERQVDTRSFDLDHQAGGVDA